MELYLKNQLVEFRKELGNINKVIPYGGASRNRPKRRIQTCRPMDAKSKEKMKIFFVSGTRALFSLFHSL